MLLSCQPVFVVLALCGCYLFASCNCWKMHGNNENKSITRMFRSQFGCCCGCMSALCAYHLIHDEKVKKKIQLLTCLYAFRHWSIQIPFFLGLIFPIEIFRLTFLLHFSFCQIDLSTFVGVIQIPCLAFSKSLKRTSRVTKIEEEHQRQSEKTNELTKMAIHSTLVDKQILLFFFTWYTNTPFNLFDLLIHFRGFPFDSENRMSAERVKRHFGFFGASSVSHRLYSQCNTCVLYASNNRVQYWLNTPYIEYFRIINSYSLFTSAI